MKLAKITPLILVMQILCLLYFGHVETTTIFSDEYKNMRFWDVDIGGCFFSQETTNSCVPASVQMVLEYLDFSPLANQTQLATEMNTEINHTTEWRYVYIPFKERGFSKYHNQSLSNDFNRALANLKGNVSKNFPAILEIWYNEQAKSEGKVTHAVVVTGYNSTGIFVHDPWYQPHRFLNYSAFSSLWETDSGYWAFMVEVEPRFDMIVEAQDWFGNVIPGVQFTLSGENNQTSITDLNGTAKFSNLTMGNYVLSYQWRFQSDKYNIALTKMLQVNCRLLLSNPTIVVMVTLFLIIIVVVIILRLRKSARAKCLMLKFF